ncbi:glycine cleavage system protein GcvH [Dactylosporangium sp. NPDC051485]|uniref:glycine cleavage system protein GcvH n=1 Tax=Dactylosporangium sp. NPDC051485 TaxID=3154846 RepID=UPI00343DFECD
MTVPPNLQYTRDHEWIADLSTVGITRFAADALGDIVYLDLPEPGREVRAGEPCGEIESTKSVSDLLAPADGVVEEVNPAVAADPALINEDPYANWLFRMRVTGAADLLDIEAYTALIGSQ